MVVSYIHPIADISVINLFADYIVSKLKNSRSLIKVTNHKNFVVVDGETTSKEVLNLNELKNDFFEKGYTDKIHLKSNFNIIDIIKYNKAPFSANLHHFTYYNSKRPIYHPEIIKYKENPSLNLLYYSKISYNNKLIFEILEKDISSNDYFQSVNYLSYSSSFPFGYSKDSGRTAFYYGEYICNHLFNYLNVDEIHLKINLNRNSEEDDFDIQIFSDSIYDSEKIQSLVLDVFDFNLPKFENEYLKDYDYTLDITDPIGDKPWLVKDKIKDILIF